MNELQIFSNEKFGELEVIAVEGKAYFAATESAKMLKYSNPHDAISKHCRKDGVVKREVIDSMGRTQQKNFISEGNLLRLIAHSKMPGAAELESWIFDEVIPTVLHHGAYLTPEKIEEVLTNPDTIIQLATILKKEQEKNKVLQIENVQQKQIIEELKPKADYTDLILSSKSLVTITQIAKDYGMSGQAMNKKLFELGVQYKQKDQWLLYAKYHDKGYTHSETVSIAYTDGTTGTKMNTEWTQKGRLFLYELLKMEGILPVIEREEEEQYKEMFTC